MYAKRFYLTPKNEKSVYLLWFTNGGPWNLTAREFLKSTCTHKGPHKYFWKLHLQITSMKLFCFSNNLNCYSPVTVQYQAQSTLAIYTHTTFCINSYLCCKQIHLHPRFNRGHQKAPHILPIAPLISNRTSLQGLSSDQISSYNLHKMFLKIVRQDTGLRQLRTELLMRWNKPLLLETTAATNVVQTKEQEKYHMPCKLNQDHRLSPELELTVLDNLVSSW